MFIKIDDDQGTTYLIDTDEVNLITFEHNTGGHFVIGFHITEKMFYLCLLYDDRHIWEKNRDELVKMFCREKTNRDTTKGL